MVNQVLNTTPPTSSAQSVNQKPNGAPEEFGSVLAQKMSSVAATDKTPAPVKATENKADKSDQDQTPAPDAASNPLAALLLGTQVLKAVSSASDVAKSDKDKTLQITDTTNSALAALLPGNPEIKVTNTNSVELGANSGKALRSAESVSTHQASRRSTNEKLDPATKPSTSAESVATTPSALKADAETLKLTNSASNLQAPSAQVQAQSVSAQIALSQMPNVASSPNSIAAPSDSIAAPLGSTAWPDEFSQKISWLSTQQSQVAELHLNPPDLGPMSVVLTISDNQATALFTSPHSAVREAIENAMPKLRESLAENGIMLGNATVSDQSPRDGGASGSMNQRNNTRADVANTTPTEAPTAPLIAARRHNGMVDTFA